MTHDEIKDINRQNLIAKTKNTLSSMQDWQHREIQFFTTSEELQSMMSAFRKLTNDTTFDYYIFERWCPPENKIIPKISGSTVIITV